MAKQIAILQIGATDWTEQVKDEPVDWTFCQGIDLPVLLARQEQPKKLEADYVLLTDPTLDSVILARQIRDWPAYRVIYLGDFSSFSPVVQQALADRGAFYFEEQTTESVVNRILSDLFKGQVGFASRFSEKQFIPENNWAWHWQRAGRFDTRVSGDFGEDFQQIGTLKTFQTDFQPGQENLIYADYSTTGTAELALAFVFYQNGGLQQLKLFQNPDIRQMPMVRAPKQYLDYQILVLAKGNGELTLRNLHQRKSRHGLGYFLPGSERLLTEDNQEVNCYFNPGTKKGPLVVAFAGARLHVEGFEMMGQLDHLGYPYLLFTDTRAAGGAFMVGSQAFENLVIARINEAQMTLKQEAVDTIFVGYSMGSYPAMYYAGRCQSQHIVIAKPIINIGRFTQNGALAHQGENYDWPLDVRQVLTGRLDLQDSQQLDEKLWSSLANVDWPKARVDLFTMLADEYDGGSLGELLTYFNERGAKIRHQEVPGHHDEKIKEMLTFIEEAIQKQGQEERGLFY